MPLYQGELLSTRLARRPLVGLEEGRNVAIKLARGIGALHRAGIIHRDIKPDNIILEAEGSLKLIDLGVVRVPGLEDFPAEDIPGTLAYMAPEMLSAEEKGNEQTDIYALGVTMFRAFTGEFPYGNIDAVNPSRKSRPTPLAELRPDLPAWLQEALERAIALDPGAALSRCQRIRRGDGGRAGARADGRAATADALRAAAGPVLARGSRDPRVRRHIPLVAAALKLSNVPPDVIMGWGQCGLPVLLLRSLL